MSEFGSGLSFSFKNNLSSSRTFSFAAGVPMLINWYDPPVGAGVGAGLVLVSKVGLTPISSLRLVTTWTSVASSISVVGWIVLGAETKLSQQE